MRIKLQLKDRLPTDKPPSFLLLPHILQGFSDSCTLRSLVISIGPGKQPVTRHEILDVLCSNALKDALKPVRTLEEYIIEVKEQRIWEARDPQWWFENIRNWSPTRPGVRLEVTTQLVSYSESFLAQFERLSVATGLPHETEV